MEFSKERSQKVADQFIPFIQLIDVLLDDLDLGYARSAVERMESDVGTMDAASILLPDGLERADDARDRVEFFNALIKIFEIRKRQKKNVIKRLGTVAARDRIAKQLGFI